MEFKLKGIACKIFFINFVIFFSISFSFILNNILNNNDHLFQVYDSAVKSGESHLKKGNFDKAIEFFSKGVKFASELDNKEVLVQCYVRLGLLYWNTGWLKDSTDFYSHALSLAEKIDFRKRQEECLSALEIYKLYTEGKRYRNVNQPQRSIESFEKAIELAKVIRSKAHELKCLRQLSVTYWNLNDLQTFHSLNEKALTIAKKLNHRREEGYCYINIGLYHQKLNDYSKALSFYGKSQKIVQDLENKGDESAYLNNIGNVYRAMGSYDKALRYLMEALAIERELGNKIYVSYNLNNIGITYRLKGLVSGDKRNFDKALIFYHESLQLAKESSDRKIEVKVLNNIGILYSYLENYPVSLKYLQPGYKLAKQIQDFEAVGMILNNMGMVNYDQGNYDDAEKFYKQAIESGRRISGEQILWEAYFGLGRCHERENEFPLAVKCYKKAIDVIDQIRSQIVIDSHKAGFVRDKLRIYESLINLLYRINRADSSSGFKEEIFHIVEKAKARAFLEILGESKVNIRERLNPELKKIEKDISDNISSLIRDLRNVDMTIERKNGLLTKLQQAEDEYLNFLSKMRLETPGIANIVSPEPCHLEQIQRQLLDEKKALIEYFLGEEQSYLFLVTKNNFESFLLPSREEIKKSLKAYLKILSDPPRDKFRENLAAKRLYKELLYPAEQFIPETVENLIIVPDGILCYFPFEALILPVENRSSRNEYLISRYKISYSPSSSSLIFLTEKKGRWRHPKDLLALGDPSYKTDDLEKGNREEMPSEILKEIYQSYGFDFSPLPYSNKEIKKISSFFSKEKMDLYIKNDASENKIKTISLNDYQIIHFACHGFLDERFPFRSALVLSMGDDTREDGFLQVREVYNLRLSAELVVLSACQTGKGRLENGEGILGLPRIFFYSGARSVVSTLWKIGDKPTAEFMEDFYDYLTQGRTKAQALRLAKLKMIKSEYSHPFYWAAFILNGDYSSRLY